MACYLRSSRLQYDATRVCDAAMSLVRIPTVRVVGGSRLLRSYVTGTCHQQVTLTHLPHLVLSLSLFGFAVVFCLDIQDRLM